MTLTHQHSLRKTLTDELHARPFTPITPPAQIYHVSLWPEEGARADPKAALDHLNELLVHLGAAPVTPENGRPPRVYVGAFAGFRLKWERHVEFVSYMLTCDGGRALFENVFERLTPPGWLDRSPGRVISACLIEVIAAADDEDMERVYLEEVAPHLNLEASAVSRVTDGEAAVMGDFRIGADGFTRFAVISRGAGPRRLGRIAQRLIEVETYRILAMAALPLARRITPQLERLEKDLAACTRAIADPAAAIGQGDPEADRRSLAELSAVSAELERLAVETAFRFSAASAYGTLVRERIEALRERRMMSRQTFEEFMVRRFRPALRTVASVEARLAGLAQRGERTANLLRTRIDVALESQNQELLRSMNRRADLQLRLQKTVEGLSVVAIGYYAVSLAGYAFGPLGELVGLGHKGVMAALTPPVLIGVYLMLRQVKKGLE